MVSKDVGEEDLSRAGVTALDAIICILQYDVLFFAYFYHFVSIL